MSASVTVTKEWQSGSYSIIKKSDILTVREACEAIRKKNAGKLTAKLVYRAARRNPDGILAKYAFRDTPEDAAEKWYLQQCQEIIQAVQFTVKELPDLPAQREYVSVVHKTEKQPGVTYSYITIDEALTDSRYRDQMFTEAKAAINLWKNKYEWLQQYYVLVRKIISTMNRHKSR